METGINSNVIFEDEKQYLLRINGESTGIYATQDDAMNAISAIASVKEKELCDSGVEVFRKYLQDGKEIQLHVLVPGKIFSGALTAKVIIDILPISKLKFISPYADRIAQYKTQHSKKKQ